MDEEEYYEDDYEEEDEFEDEDDDEEVEYEDKDKDPLYRAMGIRSQR